MNELTAPVMALLSEGTLDPGEVPKTGVPVIMNIAAAHARQVLNLILERSPSGERLYTSPNLPIGSSGRPLTLRIPQQHFLDRGGQALQVFYTLSEAGSSPKLQFTTKQGFSGEVKVDLSARLYQPLYVNGEVRLPKTLPSYLFLDRPAPGAVAYNSSDESVAEVDANGRVKMIRNGQAIILADLPDGPQSYTLVISGIRGLEVLSTKPVPWQNAKNLCDSLAMTLPDSRDFMRMVEAYGADLSKALDPRAPLWGALVGNASAVTLNPLTLAVTSESTQSSNLRQVIGVG